MKYKVPTYGVPLSFIYGVLRTDNGIEESDTIARLSSIARLKTQNSKLSQRFKKHKTQNRNRSGNENGNGNRNRNSKSPLLFSRYSVLLALHGSYCMARLGKAPTPLHPGTRTPDSRRPTHLGSLGPVPSGQLHLHLQSPRPSSG
jgi:hypothetical protein